MVSRLSNLCIGSITADFDPVFLLRAATMPFHLLQSIFDRAHFSWLLLFQQQLKDAKNQDIPEYLHQSIDWDSLLIDSFIRSHERGLTLWEKENNIESSQNEEVLSRLIEVLLLRHYFVDVLHALNEFNKSNYKDTIRLMEKVFALGSGKSFASKNEEYHANFFMHIMRLYMQKIRCLRIPARGILFFDLSNILDGVKMGTLMAEMLPRQCSSIVFIQDAEVTPFYSDFSTAILDVIGDQVESVSFSSVYQPQESKDTLFVINALSRLRSANALIKSLKFVDIGWNQDHLLLALQILREYGQLDTLEIVGVTPEFAVSELIRSCRPEKVIMEDIPPLSEWSWFCSSKAHFMDVDERVVNEFALSVPRSASLRELKLGQITLTDEDVVHSIVQLLRGVHSIRRVELDSLLIWGESMKLDLLGSIVNCTRLESLSLSRIVFPLEGQTAMMLKRLVEKQSKTLESLAIRLSWDSNPRTSERTEIIEGITEGLLSAFGENGGRNIKLRTIVLQGPILDGVVRFGAFTDFVRTVKTILPLDTYFHLTFDLSRSFTEEFYDDALVLELYEAAYHCPFTFKLPRETLHPRTIANTVNYMKYVEPNLFEKTLLNPRLKARTSSHIIAGFDEM